MILRHIAPCTSLEKVRANIDRIDRQIVSCVAERSAYVRQAAKFRKPEDDRKMRQRMELVIARVVALSSEFGADARQIESVYRAMIDGFICSELTRRRAQEVTGSDEISSRPTAS